MNLYRRSGLALALLLALLFSVPHSGAQSDSTVKAAYDKGEQMITMRDGVRLFTVIYSPKDRSQKLFRDARGGNYCI
jgi:hypothetical protein